MAALGSGLNFSGVWRRGTVVVGIDGDEDEESMTGGTTNIATIGLWSEVVYEGIEVYTSGVIREFPGVSEYVA